jgi:hypothetical protein
MHSGRLLIAHGAIAPFDDAGASALVSLRAKKTLSVSEDELPSFLAAMYALPRVPPIDLPATAASSPATPRRRRA